MAHKKGETYKWRPCANCGAVVAHAKDGRALHMHRRSKKCRAAKATLDWLSRRLRELASRARSSPHDWDR